MFVCLLVGWLFFGFVLFCFAFFFVPVSRNGYDSSVTYIIASSSTTTTTTTTDDDDDDDDDDDNDITEAILYTAWQV